MLPTPADVIAAAHRLRGVVTRTPLVAAPLLGADVWLKCENLQRTGSFKLRGAYNALSLLSPEQRARGVVASSAGNHGLGLAYAARALGIRAHVFVPATAPAVKRDGIAALGARVSDGEPHYDAAHAAAERFAASHGMMFVNPCAGLPLLAGQGTVALEIVEDLPTLRTLVVPVGGAGLLGGVGAIMRAVAHEAQIIGVQSDRTNAMAAALEIGRLVEIGVEPTLADGLAGQIDQDALEIGRVALDDMLVVTEAEIAHAIAWLARHHELRVEGSGAVGVAALLAGVIVPTGPTAVIISGGNIDEARWRGLVDVDVQTT